MLDAAVAIHGSRERSFVQRDVSRPVALDAKIKSFASEQRRKEVGRLTPSSGVDKRSAASYEPLVLLEKLIRGRGNDKEDRLLFIGFFFGFATCQRPYGRSAIFK